MNILPRDRSICFFACPLWRKWLVDWLCDLLLGLVNCINMKYVLAKHIFLIWWQSTYSKSLFVKMVKSKASLYCLFSCIYICGNDALSAILVKVFILAEILVCISVWRVPWYGIIYMLIVYYISCYEPISDGLADMISKYQLRFSDLFLR